MYIYRIDIFENGQFSNKKQNLFICLRHEIHKLGLRLQIAIENEEKK